MKTYTTQQLQEQYEKLPDALKDAIFSVEVAEKIFETGKKHGLTVEKIGFLAEETGRVILGLTRPNEFVAALAERLGSGADTAQKIASDVNHQIFFPLREILKTTHQVNVGGSLPTLPALGGMAPLGPRPMGTVPSISDNAGSGTLDLRSLARPPAAAPPPAAVAPPGTAKVPPIDRPAADVARYLRHDPFSHVTVPAYPAADVAVHSSARPDATNVSKIPPIDLRKRGGDESAQPPLVDVGNLRAAASRPADFLTREEVEKVVAEKRITAPPPPPRRPPQLQPLGNSVSNLETEFPSIRVAEPKTSPANPHVSPHAITPFSPSPPQASPQSSPQAVPLPTLPSVERTAPMGQGIKSALRLSEAATSAAGPQTTDLRQDKEIPLDFKPQPPIAPRPAPQTLETPHRAPPAPVLPPASKIPPIDLRQAPKPPTPLKTKPWSGTDPYKEPIE